MGNNQMPFRLVLPYPVSSNRYWVTFPYIERGEMGFSDMVRAALHAIGNNRLARARELLQDLAKKKPRAVTVPSAEAKTYKEEVAWRAKVAGFKEPTDKLIEIASITLCPRMNKDGSASAVVLDLGNCWKVVEDALQGVVYVNDKQIKRIRNVEYGPPTKDGALIIEVVEYIPVVAPLFAEAAA